MKSFIVEAFPTHVGMLRRNDDDANVSRSFPYTRRDAPAEVEHVVEYDKLSLHT